MKITSLFLIGFFLIFTLFFLLLTPQYTEEIIYYSECIDSCTGCDHIPFILFTPVLIPIGLLFMTFYFLFSDNDENVIE